jgi:Flp pilus assembly protein TadB
MSAAEKVGSFAAMAAMVIMPNFWLASSPLLLVLFWIFALPTLAAFPRHFCKRCRHRGCPMNRASFPDAL